MREAGMAAGVSARGGWTARVIGAVAALALWTGAASAETINFADGQAVSTSAALSYYGTPTSPTRAADPLVTDTAHALGDDIDRIFFFVRDQVDVTPLFGVQKGARGALIDMAARRSIKPISSLNWSAPRATRRNTCSGR
jgi:hypothetical protein